MRPASVLLLLIPCALLAGSVSLTLDFWPEQLVFEKANRLDGAALPGEYWTSARASRVCPWSCVTW